VNPSSAQLCQRLGYAFRDPELLREALTHRSVGSRNNERLEYLGDAALSFVIAEALYERHPGASEGELSRLRASLVKRESLAVLARELMLGEFLFLGGGEQKSGGFRRDSILADALEAVIGAVHLDGGFEACRTLLLRLFEQRLGGLPEAETLKDPKTRLQEWLQSRRLPLPEYQVAELSGDAHAQSFVVECRVANLPEPAIGRGNSRRKAEQAAAEHALELIGNGHKSR
jgi:ribonuclease-3